MQTEFENWLPGSCYTGRYGCIRVCAVEPAFWCLADAIGRPSTKISQSFFIKISNK